MQKIKSVILNVMVVIKLDQINSNGKYKSVIGKNKGELFLCVQLNHDDDYQCY